jgi:tetratricopeptide (TPR) repeat protein
MQVYGFARIYDAKSEPNSRTPGWLDQMICVLWFGLCAFVLSNVLPMYVTRFYESGGPALPAAAFDWLKRIWVASTVAFTGLYLFRTARNARQGRVPNPLKFVLMVVTFVYLAYTVSMIDQPLMGYAMFESWHDLQYLAIVWLFNVNRARNNPQAGGAFIRMLFRPHAILAIAYVLICLVFGFLTHAWRFFDNPVAARIAFSSVMATALLHYYLDGFIWKIRERDTRQALGVTSNAEPVVSSGWIPAWGRHALLWMLFAVPVGVLFAMESRGDARPLQVFETLVATFPSSAQAHYELGKQLQEAARLREAKVHFEKALQLSPGLHDAHTLLGALLSAQGDYGEAITHLRQVLNAQPQNAQAHNNLGIVFDQQENPSGAREEFELAVKINPDYALAHNNLGTVLAKLGELAKARHHYEEALRINPDFEVAHYQLGLTLAEQGDLNGAAEHLEHALRIAPDQYLTYNSLGAVLANQGKLAEARLRFEQALRIKPDYADARQNLASTEEKLLRLK